MKTTFEHRFRSELPYNPDLPKEAADRLVKQLEAVRAGGRVLDEDCLLDSMVNVVKRLAIEEKWELLKRVYTACPDGYRPKLIAQGFLVLHEEHPSVKFYPDEEQIPIRVYREHSEGFARFIAALPLEDSLQDGFALALDNMGSEEDLDRLMQFATLVDGVYRNAAYGHESRARELNGYLHVAILRMSTLVIPGEFDWITQPLNAELRTGLITKVCQLYLGYEVDGLCGDVWQAFAMLASAPDRLKENDALSRGADEEFDAVMADTSYVDLRILKEWLHQDAARWLESKTGGLSYQMLNRSPTHFKPEEDWKVRLVQFIAKIKCLGDRWLNAHPVEAMTGYVLANYGSIDFLTPDDGMAEIIGSPMGCVLFNDPPKWLLDIGSLALQVEKQVETEYKSLDRADRAEWVLKRMELITTLGDNKLSHTLVKPLLVLEPLASVYEWKTRWDKDWPGIDRDLTMKIAAGRALLRSFESLAEIMDGVPEMFLDAVEKATINIRQLSLDLLRRFASPEGNSVALVKHRRSSEHSPWDKGEMYVTLALWSCDLSEVTRATVLFERLFRADFHYGTAQGRYDRFGHFAGLDEAIVKAYVLNIDRLPKEIDAVFLDFVKVCISLRLREEGSLVALDAAKLFGVLVGRKRLSDEDIPHAEIYQHLVKYPWDIGIEVFQEIKQCLNIPDSPELMKEIRDVCRKNDRDDLRARIASLPQTRFIRAVQELL